MSKRLLIIVLLCAARAQASGPSDFSSIHFHRDSVIRPEKKHSPKAATIMSLALPGLGQAYNKKYWKIPIIYLGLGISGYYIHLNKDSMRRRQAALTLLLDNDSTNNNVGYYTRKPVDQLRAERNRFRTLRDYSIIAFAGIYVLNIIDAAVDAHFYNFNIDKPLAQQRHKNWNIYSTRVGNTPAVGFCWKF
jgi:hypothetical protein